MSESRVTNESLAQDVGAAIVEVLADATNYGGPTKSKMVLEAAQAYRALRGGPQPGSVVVESK